MKFFDFFHFLSKIVLSTSKWRILMRWVRISYWKLLIPALAFFYENRTWLTGGVINWRLALSLPHNTASLTHLFWPLGADWRDYHSAFWAKQSMVPSARLEITWKHSHKWRSRHQHENAVDPHFFLSHVPLPYFKTPCNCQRPVTHVLIISQWI